MKILAMVLIVLTIFSSVSACNNTEDKSKIRKESEAAAIKWAKEELDQELIVEKSEFTTAKGGGTMFVYGHFKDTEKQVSITVKYGSEYEPKYRIGSIGYD